MLTFEIANLQSKAHKGAPMRGAQELQLSPFEATLSNRTQERANPRQILITHVDDIQELQLTAEQSRANIILSGGTWSRLGSGDRLQSRDIRLRITFRCEPCQHGAKLAGVPMRRFRSMRRYLATVETTGSLSMLDRISLEERYYASAPDSFRDRCAWALHSIPPGSIVSSSEFLYAIGASSVYARALPAWLKFAASRGLPVHRVVSPAVGPSTWAPDTVAKLADEGLDRHSYVRRYLDLTNALWASGEPPSRSDDAQAQECLFELSAL